MQIVIAFLLILGSTQVFPKPNISSYELLTKKTKAFMVSPCMPDLERASRDSIEAIKLIKKIAKDCGLKFEKIKSPNKIGGDNYILLFNNKDVVWSIWISVGKTGIKHITETWNTKNDSFLQKKFYQSFLELFETWGNPTSEDEYETWFTWDKREYGCGIMMITYEYSKKYTLVSRRLEFNK